MSTNKARCKCLHCKEFFLPNYRSGNRQRFCSKPGCQKARKQLNQRVWLSKPENQNYFRDAENAQRVRQWQKAHPGYWRKTVRQGKGTLQDACPTQPVAQEELAPNTPVRTLQDLCSLQVPLVVGIISMWIGSTLQDDIALTTRQLVTTGQDILGMTPGMNLERSMHEKTCSLSATAAQSPASLQLDRPPSGS